MKRALIVALVPGLAGLLLWPEAKPGPTGGWLKAAGLEPRFETVDGLRIRYVRAGSGPAVVLLHGIASSIYTWKDVMPALTRERDVVALDLPGFGQSDQPPDLDAARYPAVILGLMDRLGLPKAALVGNSMGGAAAVAMAATRPERVSALVLLDSAGFNLAPGQRPFILRLLAAGPIAPVLERLPVRRPLLRMGLRQVFHDPALVTAERFNEYLVPLIRPGAMASMRSLLLPRSREASQFPDLLTRVRAPALVIWGREDRWVPVEQADRFLASIPGSRKVVLEGCGHLPQEERPADVLRLLRDFLVKV